jgi:cytoskeletal protein RodZ
MPPGTGTIAMSAPDDFGACLRQARERRGLSLRDIASRTKISVSVLEALERNDLSRLPGGIFTRAFVRAYASEAGLDPERTVQEFIEHFPHDSVTAGTPHSSEAEDNEAIESEQRVARSLLTLIVLSLPIAAALVVFGVAGRRGSAPAAAPPPVNGAVSARAGEKPPPPAPAAASASAARQSGGGDAANPAGISVPTAGAAAATPVAIASSPLTLLVVARAPCWVSVSVDGTRQSRGILKPGERLQLSADHDLVLSAGNAAALELTINGVRARPFGRPGEVVTRRITPENYKSWLP